MRAHDASPRRGSCNCSSSNQTTHRDQASERTLLLWKRVRGFNDLTGVFLPRGRTRGGNPVGAEGRPRAPQSKGKCNRRRRVASMRDLPTIAFIRPPCLLRRNGPVPGILAVTSDGAIVDKSERRLAWKRTYKDSKSGSRGLNPRQAGDTPGPLAPKGAS